ncbi:hypothetical protein JYT72_01045 [Crocinitomix catalasitica]|nr:hypothetical protein [Crocinitomix catalasitica]
MSSSIKQIFLLFFMIAVIPCSAQKDDARKTKPNSILENINIRDLPTEGSFITVQVSAADSRYLLGDPNMVSAFAVFEPVFFKQGKKIGTYTIGIFNNYRDAREFANQISCILYKPFPVAYIGGDRVALEEFREGNQIKEIPSIHKAKRRLKKLLKGTYYRIQIGYYEQEGLAEEEQKIYDLLKINGIKVMEEKYKNGRIYLSKRKLKTISEAKKFEREIQGIIGRWDPYVKAYCDFSSVILAHLHRVNDCLSATR